jgi:hypothetical protein
MYWEIAVRVDRSAAMVVRICQIWEEERRGIRRRPIGPRPRPITARQAHRDRFSTSRQKRVGLLT